MQKINSILNTSTLILFALVCFGLMKVQAQKKISRPHEYIFTNYTAANGLSSSEILTLALDKKGFLWAGTAAGLSRYDGYTFTNFSFSADNYLIGIVNVIKTDTKGNLWIGASSGLYCYLQNRIIKISAETKSPQAVNDIATETNGSLWLTTENGPAYISAGDINTTGTKKIVLQNFILPQWTKQFVARYGPQCQLIKKAPDGTVYFSQQYQLFRIEFGKIEVIHTTTEENDKIEYIFPVSKSKLYFNTASTGLHKLQDNFHVNFKYDDLYQPNRKPVTEGEWFVGSLGLIYFHPGEEFISESVAFKDAGAQWLTTALKENNQLWIGSHSGLVKTKLSAFHLYKETEFNKVQESFSFCQLKNGKFLVGVNHGKIYELNGEGVKDYFPAGLQPVKYAEIKAMHEDEWGWLWMGTGYQGIALNRNGKIARFNEGTNQLHDNSFNSFLKTRKGNLYAIGDKGMSEILVDKKDNVSFRPFYSRPGISKFAKFYNGIESPDGTIWIGGEEGLFFLQHDSLHKFSLTEKNIAIRSIKISKDNQVWIASADQGIFHCSFDEKNKLRIVKQYTQKDGLNTLQYLDLMVDSEHNVWAGSVKGLTFIGTNGNNKNRLVNFSEADGFIKPGYYAMKIYQDKNDVIWAGTTLGICSFLPDDLFLQAPVPEVYLTGIDFLKQSKSTFNSDSLILKNDENNLSLPYNNNSINFNYTAVNFSGPEAIQYYYRLNGLDSNWIAAGTHRNITYYNLPAGKYIFSVKAVNEKVVWSKESSDFVFVIYPPFWQTGWFKITSILIAVCAIYLFVKNREKIIAKQEAQKTEVEKLKSINLQNQLEIEQVVNYFASAIGSQTNIDDMLWDVTKNCISKLGFEDCVIYLKDKERNVMLQKAAWGPKTNEQNKILSPIEIVFGNGVVGSVAISGKAEIIKDTSLDKRYILDDAFRLSEIAVPIMEADKVIGVIDSEHSQKNFYTNQHLHILSTVAAMLSDNIEKIRAEQQTREKQIEVLQLNKDLSDWQVAALRAQMNPHFLFNAMNSIQQFTLKNDTDNANLYLSKFSTLLRKVLHSSRQNYISLEEEIEQLQLYLSIEALRIGEGFSYEVKTGAEVETDAIKIPGMLVQPFVENALKHGLATKEGEKRLKIEFHFTAENILTATITDNGIGRDKARQLKEQQEKLLPHQSEGIHLVEERLRLLNKSSVAEQPITIQDMLDASGNALGTRVEIVLPVLQV